MATGQANAEILDDQAPTILANTLERPIVCLGSDSSKASADEDMSGTLHVGGGVAARSHTNALCADDAKGINNQYVSDGKVIVEYGR